MKTLLFLRHGKSDWDADFDHDHDRPIAKRGRKAADQMGRLLADVRQRPDSIITSSALRARQTLERAIAAGEWTAPVRVTEALYGAYSGDVLREIQAEPDATERLLLVGHEPTWSSSISRFIGGGDIAFPTAAMARIDFNITRWREADFKKGQLIWLIPPKLFT